MNIRVLAAVSLALASTAAPCRAEELWKKHVVHEGVHATNAYGADFTKDGLPDVITNCGGKTRLLVAPEWREVIIDDTRGYDAIHSEAFDVDRDGDLDWIGARYSPGLVFWLEQPDDPVRGPWKPRIVDDVVNGVHGLLQGDIDGDGRLDLIANSAQPVGELPDSAVWLRVPPDPRAADRWERFPFAVGDAPGLSHYFGFGDVNGDGRADIALAAKGTPDVTADKGRYFAWWEAPADPRQRWRKHLIAEGHLGATNIMPAEVNGDGRTDFIATRGHARGVLWFEAPDWKPHVMHETLLEPHSLQVADFDSDGDVDAATCGYGDRLAVWLENDGRGRFTSHTIATDQAAYDLRAVDMDRDGDLDVLIAGQQSRNVAWYENPLKR